MNDARGQFGRAAELFAEANALQLDEIRRRGRPYSPANFRALVDQLNPRYLARVIRLDPWHQPYLYEGERDRYVLRSAGPDAEPGTADDISVAGP